MAFLRVICWALIFISHKRFPSGKSLVNVLRKRNRHSSMTIVQFNISQYKFNTDITRHILTGDDRCLTNRLFNSPTTLMHNRLTKQKVKQSTLSSPNYFPCCKSMFIKTIEWLLYIVSRAEAQQKRIRNRRLANLHEVDSCLIMNITTWLLALSCKLTPHPHHTIVAYHCSYKRIQ